MIEDSKIVQETRKVRYSISERFGNDPDRYIDYLFSLESKGEGESEPSPDEFPRHDQTYDCGDRH
ncbi:MAG: hypothetical protein V1792_03150 [Pseudomonadota bacterium]